MRKQSIFILAGVFLLLSACSKKVIEGDILVKNGIVYTGELNKPTNDVVVVKKGKIVYVGEESKVNIRASRTIDATGLIVSPGFIDPHTHADRDLNNKETAHNLPFLMQGVTTVVVGNDGDSYYPAKKYQELYKQQGVGTNVVQLIGQHAIIEAVIGKSDVDPTPDQMKEMQVLMQQEMDAGAFGMSTGLYYSPGSYTSTEEVIALAKIVAQNGGIYDTHLRDESSNTIGLVNAVKEAIDIGKGANLPVHISHIKCLGVDVWKQSDTIIKMVEVANKKGMQVTANQYPYDASATSLNAAVAPRWAESGGKDSLMLRVKDLNLKKRILEETKVNIRRRGGADKLLIVKCDDEAYLGKTLTQIAKQLHKLPEEAVYDVLGTGYVRVASFNMNPYDIHNFMKQDWVVTGSDGNTGHPRKYGSFPRKYRKYVKQDKILNLERFIHGSTGKTADIFNIPDRGYLKEGFFADIIVFNPDTFKDVADYKNAFQYAEGLEYAIVNGKVSVDKGKYNGGLNGVVIKRK